MDQSSRCRHCGLLITRKDVRLGWWSNRSQCKQEFVEGKEPWFTACPGSEAMLAECPTYGEWSLLRQDLFTDGLTEHQPMDDLGLLAMEVIDATRKPQLPLY